MRANPDYIISESDMEAQHDASLNEIYPEIDVCGYHYSAAYLLKTIDRIAYDELFSAWQDATGITQYEGEYYLDGGIEEDLNYTKEEIRAFVWDALDDAMEAIHYLLDPEIPPDAPFSLQVKLTAYARLYQFYSALDPNAIESLDEYNHPGHDFILTIGGHGCGFWDGDYRENVPGLNRDLGEYLTEICHTIADIELYLGDDGRIYVY